MPKKRKPNPDLIDDENPEWTAEDFAHARANPHVLSPEFLANWAKGGHTIEHVTDEEYEASKRKARLAADMKVVYQFTKYSIDTDGQPTGPRYATLSTIERIHGAVIKDSLRPVKAEYVDSDGFYCGPELVDR